MAFLGALPLWAQETPAPVKKVKVKREDVVSRAYKKAHALDSQVLARVTLSPNEDATVLAVAEYASGDVAVFVGDEDPEKDTFAVVGEDNLAILDEALKRAAARRPWAAKKN